MIIEFKGMRPDVSRASFIAENATISGDVILGEESSVWFSAAIRGEVESIRIGNKSNVQDNATLHSDYDCPIIIGDRVSVGHNAIVHGAIIEDDVIVGMHATVMDGARVGRGSLIAAGALVKEHEIIPERSLVVG
ncbi:MAG: gamma carbonic anhydrase family protein, partial [Raoultibacter sp.]